MITLLLVDLDNLLVGDRVRRMPDVASVQAMLHAVLPEAVSTQPAREVTVVVGLNNATTGAGDVSWEAVRALAAGLASTVEQALRGCEPSRVRVEPALMPSVPEAVDGALVRLVTNAAGADGAGTVGEVVLVSADRGLRGAVRRLLPGFRERASRGVTWWRLTATLRREPPQLGSSVAAPPRTRPTRIIENAAHAAWAAGRPVQLEPCDLRHAGGGVLTRPWLRTQLSVTGSSTSGPARLGTLLNGELPALVASAGEVLDYQNGRITLSPGARLEEVGPGTVRARWGQEGAQVLSTFLPYGIVRQALPVSLDRGARIDTRAVLRRLEGQDVSDPSWTVVFHRSQRGFFCEAEGDSAWPALWWHRPATVGRWTAKLGGDAVCTPRRIAAVPVRIRIQGGRLLLRSSSRGGVVSLERPGRPGQLVEATGPHGRCVVLCTTPVRGETACVPVQDADLKLLAASLSRDAASLERQGVPALPVLVPSVRSGPRRASKGKGR